MTRQTSPTYRSTAKLVVCKETFLPKCYQMRIGYITCVIYNTPDNLRIAWEDNLIENRQATERLPTHYQQSADCRPTGSLYFRQNLSTVCRSTDGQLSADCRRTVSWHSANSRPTGFLGSSSSQLPKLQPFWWPWQVKNIFNLVPKISTKRCQLAINRFNKKKRQRKAWKIYWSLVKLSNRQMQMFCNSKICINLKWVSDQVKIILLR